MKNEQKKIVLVKMKRDEGQNPPPYTADVHPNEVENWKQHGWVEVK